MPAARRTYVRAFVLLIAVLASVSAAAVSGAASSASGSSSYLPDPRLLGRSEDLREHLASAQRARDTPQARADRQASRYRHRGRSRSEALALAREKFAVELDQPVWAPLGLRQGERVQSYRGPFAAVVKDAEGKSLLATSTLPLTSEVHNGSATAADLALVESAAGYAPRNPLVATLIDRDSRRGVKLGASALGFGLVGEAAGDAPQVVKDKVFWANTATDTDFVVTPMPVGVETAWIVRSADSPESATLDFTLPAGARLEQVTSAQGGINIVSSDDKPLGRIHAPVAWDADGTDIPVSAVIDGSRVHVRFAHRERDVAYPLYVDPIVEVYQLDYQGNRAYVPDNVWAGWQTADSGSGFSFTKASPQYNTGLHISTINGRSYQDRSFGEWYWKMPRPQAYIARADFGYVTHEYNYTCLIEGTYNGSNSVVAESRDAATGLPPVIAMGVRHARRHAIHHRRLALAMHGAQRQLQGARADCADERQLDGLRVAGDLHGSPHAARACVHVGGAAVSR
jgi:hypothetical protein